MNAKKKIPVGVDNFEDMIRNDFYYVDKTGLIADLIQNWGQVNLFTKPRRFGKTLNMSMLRYFFEVGTDKSLFDGLYISDNKSICDEYMERSRLCLFRLRMLMDLHLRRRGINLRRFLPWKLRDSIFLWTATGFLRMTERNIRH